MPKAEESTACLLRTCKLEAASRFLRRVPEDELRTKRLLLTDASPLVAMVVPTDLEHYACRTVFGKLRQVMVTTWPAFTEASFLVGRYAGWSAQQRLWQFVVQKQLVFGDIADPLRVADLMGRYRDRPMDLADGTLVALAEQDGYRRIFTLDADFYIYRLAGGRVLDVVP